MRKKTHRSELTQVMRAARPQRPDTSLERARDHNQRRALHAIRVSGPVTRTDLASMTGLTPAAIANITKRLLKNRMILACAGLAIGLGNSILFPTIFTLTLERSSAGPAADVA
jgi:hypothetical protein